MTEHKNKYLIYRGYIRAMVAREHTLIFTTEHPEGQPMGVYFVNVDSAKAKKVALPGGGVAMVRDDAHVFVACTDGHVYRGGIDGEDLTTTGTPFDDVPDALALTRDGGLAVAVGNKVHIVSRDSGAPRQTLELAERVTVMTVDAFGQWLVVGTDRGTIAVFDGEETAEFKASASSKLHEGKVTALLFESEELRVLSTGSDTRLLVTHVRGELDPEDRGGSSMHERVVESMILGLEDRFYTAGAGRSLKSWPSGRTNRRPTTQREQVGRAKAMTLVQHDDKTHVACANTNGTITLFELDEEGKIAECVLTFNDAFAWAEHEFASSDTARREKALKRLAAFNDTKSLGMVADRVTRENDHKLKVRAVKLLGESNNPKAIKPLGELLSANPEEVRREALTGLRRLEGFEKLRPLELALATRKEDVGRDAVDALGKLAKDDDAALDVLIGALEHSGATVRSSALYKLESHYGVKSPEAHLTAIKSSQTDIRRLAIVRMFQNKLLSDARIEAALRRLAEDRDASVRLNAFLVSVLRRPKLAKALRGRDDVLNRQLFDVEMAGKPTKKGEDREPPKVAEVSLDTLSDEDYEPLLEAMASRSMDTCMKGARGLAELQDPRAFGTLLQLSRESDAGARVEACKSLEALEDPRALKRLRMMLRDGSAPVRDAAFSAVVAIEGEDWLAAARSGLSAGHEDVRQRGLQVLTSRLRQQKEPDEEGIALLGQTLNDSAQSVRSEAFKATLSLNVGGGVESALRFGNESIHADVRLDVLVELMAQFAEDWAWAMIMEFYEDPSADLRKEAFEFALKKAKKDRRRTSMTAALASSYADVRLMSVKELTERRLDDVEDLIVTALDDDDETVRRTAVAALVKAGAHELLRRAMDSKHDDVKVRAASAVANLGDPSAMDVLVALATRTEPEKDRKHEHSQWFDHVLRALEGIAELGEAGAREAIEGLIDHEHSKIRQAAVRALVWTSRPETLDTLRRVVRHSDQAVQREAALGLAYYGDRLGASMVFSSGVDVQEQLYAALGLIEHDEDQFFAFLDHDNQAIRREAFLLLLFRELGERDGVPDKCLAALSSAYPEVRLDAAGALEVFANHDKLEAYVVDAVNTFHDGKIAWSVGADVVRKLSLAVTHGGAQVRVRAARLLQQLRQEHQDEFDRQWAIYAKRYQNELDRLTSEAASPDAEGTQASEGKIQRAWRTLTAAVKKLTGAGEEASFEKALGELVFGAYVGLARQPQAANQVRVDAMRRLAARGGEGRERAMVERVLILALGDQEPLVREHAFSLLLELDMDASALATEALSTSFSDMGAKGLKLLSERGGATEGQQLLRETMLSKTDGLEVEAAKLLRAESSELEVAALAVGAAAQGLRQDSLSTLLKEYEQNDSAKEAVHQALKSRFDDVRHRVAGALAAQKVHDAYDVLVDMIQSDDAGVQRQGIDGLRRLGDAKAAPVMLDRVDNDDQDTAAAQHLIEGAAAFRDVSILDRLMGYVDRDENRWPAFRGVLMLSGHDQRIDDPNDESEDTKWLERQHPRHDAILAKLLDISYRIADGRMLSSLIPKARWAQSEGVVDSTLTPLVTFSQDNIQHAAIEALGWRLRKRNGSPDILLRVAREGSPEAQFLASEALALSGRDDGISVLMTAVTFLDNFEWRKRAVLALGELADPRSLDQLLEIVREEYHPLRAPAAQALGHMAKTPKADEIFELLVALSQGYYDLAEAALVGLRHFDTAEAWRVLRERASAGGWWVRRKAAEVLRHDASQATIDVLAQMIRTETDYDAASSAAESLRIIQGPESLETDYILVQGSMNYLPEQQKSVERLRKDGDAKRILEVLPKIQSSNEGAFLKPLVTALLAREPLPVAEVADVLDADEDRTATVAARIVGRAGTSASAEAGKVVAGAERARELLVQNLQWRKLGKHGAASRTDALVERYALMLWTCGRLQTGLTQLLEAMAMPFEPTLRPAQEEALKALSAPWVGKDGVAALEAASTGIDAQLRAVAISGLKKAAPDVARAKLTETLEDAAAFNRLLARGQADEAAKQVLRGAADNVHYQGVALPHMVAAVDIEGLLATMRNAELADETRLGALESLSTIAAPELDDELAALGKNEEEDEDLRKAAWRALRRAKRLRAKRLRAKREAQAEVGR